MRLLKYGGTKDNIEAITVINNVSKSSNAIVCCRHLRKKRFSTSETIDVGAPIGITKSNHVLSTARTKLEKVLELKGMYAYG